MQPQQHTRKLNLRAFVALMIGTERARVAGDRHPQSRLRVRSFFGGATCVDVGPQCPWRTFIVFRSCTSC